MTLSHELRALDAMNSSTLGLTRKTSDAMKNSNLWMTSATLGLELKALDAMNNSNL